jgi:hypothetical protein
MAGFHAFHAGTCFTLPANHFSSALSHAATKARMSAEPALGSKPTLTRLNASGKAGGEI